MRVQEHLEGRNKDKVARMLHWLVKVSSLASQFEKHRTILHSSISTLFTLSSHSPSQVSALLRLVVVVVVVVAVVVVIAEAWRPQDQYLGLRLRSVASQTDIIEGAAVTEDQRVGTTRHPRPTLSTISCLFRT